MHCHFAATRGRRYGLGAFTGSSLITGACRAIVTERAAPPVNVRAHCPASASKSGPPGLLACNGPVIAALGRASIDLYGIPRGPRMTNDLPQL